MKNTDKPKDEWGEHAEGYDKWYLKFNGAVENYVDWEILKKYLPENKKAKILDAAGGTGRITLPLARLGYDITICDLSAAMLDVARRKLEKEGLIDKVEIIECDVRSLPFENESFDFVLCWYGGYGALKELVRVAKKGGRVSLFLNNKWLSLIDKFKDSPEKILATADSQPCFMEDRGEKYLVVTPDEAGEMLESEGIKVHDIYAVCGWANQLGFPGETLESDEWDDRLFKQTTEMVLRLSRERSVMGMSRHLMAYGEKI